MTWVAIGGIGFLLAIAVLSVDQFVMYKRLNKLSTAIDALAGANVKFDARLVALELARKQKLEVSVADLDTHVNVLGEQLSKVEERINLGVICKLNEVCSKISYHIREIHGMQE